MEICYCLHLSARRLLLLSLLFLFRFRSLGQSSRFRSTIFTCFYWAPHFLLFSLLFFHLSVVFFLLFSICNSRSMLLLLRLPHIHSWCAAEVYVIEVLCVVRLLFLTDLFLSSLSFTKLLLLSLADYANRKHPRAAWPQNCSAVLWILTGRWDCTFKFKCYLYETN